MSLPAIIKRQLLTGMTPFWLVLLKARGVVCGNGLTLIGRPGINRKRGTTIRLGDRVTLCSSGMANPVAEGGRCRLATLAPGAEICIANDVGMSSTLICAAIRVEIGEGTLIGGGCMILDTDFHPRSAEGRWLTDPVKVAKPVSIGKHCFIGARSIILKGVTVGNGAVIGAGSVVTRNIPAGVVAAGNPATVIRATIGG